MVLTYIVAPIEAKKTKRNVSGFPVFGGMLVAVGFLLSPCKYLALLGLLDWQVFWLVFYVIPFNIIDSHKKKKNKKRE